MNNMKRNNIKKEHNQQFTVQSAKISFYLNATDPFITQLIFIVLSYPEEAHDNKEVSRQNSKLRQESRSTTPLSQTLCVNIYIYQQIYYTKNYSSHNQG